MDVSAAQPEKALSPISVTESDMMMEVRLSHSLNAKAPIFVTPSGITMCESEMQPEKAAS